MNWLDIHPKVGAAGLGGLATTVIISVAKSYGYEISPDMASALTTIITAAAGYLKSGPKLTP